MAEYHSPLGASGAERWMICPGSVELIRMLTLPESDAPDYRVDGVAAHALARKCLTDPTNPDAWEFAGQKIEGAEVTEEMTTAVQTYIDYVRPKLLSARNEGRLAVIEHPVSTPVHKDFYGTLDAGIAYSGGEYHKQTNLEIIDYKHGEGIQVDPDDNAQLKYYAYGLIHDNSEIDDVTLTIVQPRGFNDDGPIRSWQTTAYVIKTWVETKLVPAMDRTAYDKTLDAGPWCRFCPAKLVCPMLNAIFKAAATCNPTQIVQMSDASIGMSYQYIQAAKFYMGALEKEAHRRLQAGTYTGGVIKLVNKKARRVFKQGADKIFSARFGADAMTKPELKSPAEMEKLGDAAKLLVHEYAYTPVTGTTVALEDDSRREVKVQSASQAFAGVVAALPQDATEDDLLTAAAPAPTSDDELEIPPFLRRKVVDKGTPAK